MIGTDCRDKLRHNFFVLVHPCVPLHRGVQIDWLARIENSEDVHGVTGVVLDFQILQIQQLAVANDPSDRLKISRPKFPSKSSFHKRVKKNKNFIELIENCNQNRAENSKKYVNNFV